MRSMLVGERRRLAVSFHDVLSDQHKIQEIVSVADEEGCVIIDSAEVVNKPLSVGEYKLLPGRAVLLTIDCVRKGVAKIKLLCKTSDNQVVGFSRRVEVKDHG